MDISKIKDYNEREYQYKVHSQRVFKKLGPELRKLNLAPPLRSRILIAFENSAGWFYEEHNIRSIKDFDGLLDLDFFKIRGIAKKSTDELRDKLTPLGIHIRRSWRSLAIERRDDF